jgi:hypothetical protein
MGHRIGITIVGHTAARPVAVDHALWSSGLIQNVVFLARLLHRLADVETVALVACGGQEGAHPLAETFGLPCIEEENAAAAFDIVIELGARCAPAVVDQLRRNGGKIVSYMAGNVLAMNFEAVACHVPHGEILSTDGFDAVWITPQHWRMNRAYARMTRSDAVFEAPHIWAPDILQLSAARQGKRLFWNNARAGEPMRVGVFDPNVNVLKTFHLPLMACEVAYRSRPNVVDRVLLFSATQLRELPHFIELCGATDIFRAGKLFVEERYPLTEMLGWHIDAIVTHQWENGLNYLYWDALYAGYPLIHNAAAIADVGYYFKDFDPQDGARALTEAFERHSAEYAQTRPKVLEALWQRHIDNPANQVRYAELIASVRG